MSDCGVLTVNHARLQTSSAHFASTNRVRIDHLFSQATTGSGIVACQTFVTPSSILGTDPSCAWTSTSTFVISLGPEATIVPGSLLNLTSGLRTIDRVSDPTGLIQATVNTPQIGKAPSIMVSHYYISMILYYYNEKRMV